jgi:valyl-tRNA synthetase
LRAPVRGPQAAVALAERASEDLRAAGKVSGDLLFTATDDADITVDAQIAPAPPG